MNGYEQDVCPYDIGQLITAKCVITWVLENCKQIPNNNILISNIFEMLDNCILKEVSRQVKIRRLEDYSIEELEKEIACRKQKEK